MPFFRISIFERPCVTFRSYCVNLNCMKRCFLLLCALSVMSSYLVNAQIKKKTKPEVSRKSEQGKKYPSLLWEITGNGLNRPSYLFGTMHVSDKLVFHLGDSFYNANMKQDGRHLDHKTLEEIRRMAVARVREGEVPSAVIASYGFCRTTIYRWLRTAKGRGRGLAALRSRKGTGRPRKLTATQGRQVFRWINGKDPRQ